MGGDRPIARGIFLAAVSAALFGLTAPLVQRASAHAGPLAAGSLLYLGAACVAWVSFKARRQPDREAPLRWNSAGLILAVALLGGLLAPMFLVAGLQRIDAASGSLLLALETPFTVLLATVVHKERLGRYVLLATVVMVAGAIIATGSRLGDRASLAGGALIAAATLCWAVDNILSRFLADRDAWAIVTAKGLVGGTAAAVAAVALGQSWPAPRDLVLLLVMGGSGFGMSLHCYLRAQRTIGAARTASVFSAAPLIGVTAALLLGTPWPGWPLPVAAALVLTGLWLHARERHDHVHGHETVEHEHIHTHDDRHHEHTHDPMPPEAHSHWHRHGPITHHHGHGEDLHHRHDH